MPTPKTADAHRQQESAKTDPDNDGDTPLPDDGGGSGGGLLSSVNISHKRLLFLGAAALLAYLAYRTMNASSSTKDLTEEVEETFEEVERETSDEAPEQPDDPNIEYDPNNPLDADSEAMDWLRGNKGDEEDVFGGDDG